MRAAALRRLPSPELMARRFRTFAMLDAILAPEVRSFEFHPNWSKGGQMGVFKDGCGGAFHAWLGNRGAVIRGFDHDSVMSPLSTG